MKHFTRIQSIALAVLVGTGASAAQEKPASIREITEVDHALILLEAGYRIQRNCDRIKPRMLRSYNFAKSLQKKARDAGFSDDEIEAYVEDKAEKERVKQLAMRYLVSKGLDPEVPETYCTVGDYEIGRNSQIGVLLKSK